MAELIGHMMGVYAIAFSPDGNILASGGDDKKIRLWDLSTGQTGRQLIGHSSRIRSLTFSPDGHHLASAGDDGTVRLWGTTRGGEIQRLFEPPFLPIF
jgi:WD40 repeat protein